MARDYYEVLGVGRGAPRRRDQEGLPQAGPRVPPRPQPRRPGGGGALQGGPGRLRHALRPREAQGVRRRRAFGGFGGGGRGGRPAGGFARRHRRHLLDDLPPRRPGRASRPRAGATSRPRSASASSRRWTAPRSRSRSPSSRPARPAAATARSPGTMPITCPRCGGRGIDSESQGFFSISQPCPQCGGAGQIIEDPCPTCGGSGLTHAAQALPRQDPGRRPRRQPDPGRGQGRGRAARRTARRPVRGHPGRTVARLPPARRRQPRGDRADHGRGGDRAAATIEVPTLNGTKRIRIPAGTQHGTSSGCAARGRRSRGPRARRHPLPASRSRCRRISTDEQQRRARGLRQGDERSRPARAAAARRVRAPRRLAQYERGRTKAWQADRRRGALDGAAASS